MHRGYEGYAPGGLTWYKLANLAGGKQAPGVVGVSLAYLRSPKAFAGEGGLSSIKWATEKALGFMQERLPPNARVATETDATTLDELKAYLAARS
jgi:CO dehydrogenase/acetyl-CoA synthase beta subunit